MSVVSQFRHPADVVRHPQLEAEVKRAILASWASDVHAVDSNPALRRPTGLAQPVAVTDVLEALRSLDSDPSGA